MVEKNNATCQDLHSDWNSYPTSSMQWGYSLCCSIALHDIDADHGAMRAYSWYEPFMRDEQKYHRMPMEVEKANWFPCESRISMLAGNASSEIVVPPMGDSQSAQYRSHPSWF